MCEDRPSRGNECSVPQEALGRLGSLLEVTPRALSEMWPEGVRGHSRTSLSPGGEAEPVSLVGTQPEMAACADNWVRLACSLPSREPDYLITHII